MYLSGRFDAVLNRSKNNDQTATLQAIPDGPDGTAVTLQLMRKLAVEGKTYLPLRQLALSLVRPLGQKDFLGEIKILHAYVRDHIRYVKDVHNVETLHTVPVILANMQGDCDDKAIFLAAMLESIGHQARFIAAGRHPGQFEHVWVEARLIPANKWIGLETTMPWQCGRVPQDLPYKMVMMI